MKTVQTQATAHVGVRSRSLELPLLSLEAIATPPPLHNHETRQKDSFLYFETNMCVITNTKEHSANKKNRENWVGQKPNSKIESLETECKQQVHKGLIVWVTLEWDKDKSFIIWSGLVLKRKKKLFSSEARVFIDDE